MTIWYNKIMDTLGLVFIGLDDRYYIAMSEDVGPFPLGKHPMQELAGARWIKICDF